MGNNAASLSVSAMAGTGNEAECLSPGPSGSLGRNNLDVEHGIETASKTLRRFIYLTSFLQGVSCGILEPFCQNEMLRDIKMRKLFSWGLFIEGACCFAYEILKPFNRSLLTGIIRAIQGTGASLVFPGYFFVVCVQFPREIPTLIARVLMFPFICVGCLLIICSFWAPFMIPQYRQKHGGFKVGIGSFLADASVLMDLAIMANAFLLFVSNRFSLADVLLKARIRLMSLLGVGVSLAGLSIAASLEKFLDDP
ncbi:hypothetical protein HPB52_019799 [Rhipicephalus sanguineus]|uniref:Uncharacterized protein n=1 Tax=Rhipicephalus sanguineus TaxID=34632 RepID=A0A9D4Q7Y0_RHISA|nr:hypothetical protein HPB52_019799 [Rhipicephalus sanguineus]